MHFEQLLHCICKQILTRVIAATRARCGVDSVYVYSCPLKKAFWSWEKRGSTATTDAHSVRDRPYRDTRRGDSNPIHSGTMPMKPHEG